MKWEYMVREMSVENADKVLMLEQFLNVSGQDGWEIVGVAATPADGFTHVVYFKRHADPVTTAAVTGVADTL